MPLILIFTVVSHTIVDHEERMDNIQNNKKTNESFIRSYLKDLIFFCWLDVSNENTIIYELIDKLWTKMNGIYVRVYF